MKERLHIRPYTHSDHAHVLALIDANTPEYFAPEERPELIQYLQDEIEDYFVVMIDEVIVAAGGINYFPDHSEARISWDMVHPEYHGKGIGTHLLQYRLNHISQQNKWRTIVVRTTPLVDQFYRKSGFILQKVVKDYWAPGFDMSYLERVIES